MKKPNKCAKVGEYGCQIPMPIGGRRCDIDFCIADIIAALNAANITTVASCCGHGDESLARIDLIDGRILTVTGHSPKSDRIGHDYKDDRLIRYILDRGIISVRKLCKILNCKIEDITSDL